MPRKCTVYNCENYQGVPLPGKNISFHLFPKDNEVSPKIRQQWFARWRRTINASEKKLSTYLVCSDHFDSDDFERDLEHELLGLPLRKRLKKTAVPSILHSETGYLQKFTEKKEQSNGENGNKEQIEYYIINSDNMIKFKPPSDFQPQFIEIEKKISEKAEINGELGFGLHKTITSTSTGKPNNSTPLFQAIYFQEKAIERSTEITFPHKNVQIRKNAVKINTGNEEKLNDLSFPDKKMPVDKINEGISYADINSESNKPLPKRLKIKDEIVEKSTTTEIKNEVVESFENIVYEGVEKNFQNKENINKMEELKTESELCDDSELKTEIEELGFSEDSQLKIEIEESGFSDDSQVKIEMENTKLQEASSSRLADETASSTTQINVEPKNKLFLTYSERLEILNRSYLDKIRELKLENEHFRRSLVIAEKYKDEKTKTLETRTECYNDNIRRLELENKSLRRRLIIAEKHKNDETKDFEKGTRFYNGKISRLELDNQSLRQSLIIAEKRKNETSKTIANLQRLVTYYRRKFDAKKLNLS